MKIFVTGATGFIGSHVARALLKRGHTVRCLVRPKSDRSNLNELSVELSEGDLNDAASLERGLAGCDWLFHVAADYRLWVPKPLEMIRTNVESTRRLFELAVKQGVKKVVFTSSVSAVGRPPSNGHLGVGDETLDPSPDQLIGPYKQSKFASDQVARQMSREGVPVIIVNPSTPIGSHDIKPTPTGKMIVDFLNNKMPGYVNTGLNFVDVEDVAEGHCLAAEKGKIGERYILGHQDLSLKAFLEILAGVAGKKAPRFQIPYAVAWAAGAVSTASAVLFGGEPSIPLDGVRMAHETMYYNPSKAIRELGLPQTPIPVALEKAVRWFRENNYVKVKV